MKELAMFKELKRRLGDVDRDDLLELVGLEERQSAAERALPNLALFGAGVLIGVGVGLMLAPKPGAALREDLKARLHTGDAEKAEA